MLTPPAENELAVSASLREPKSTPSRLIAKGIIQIAKMAANSSGLKNRCVFEEGSLDNRSPLSGKILVCDYHVHW